MLLKDMLGEGGEQQAASLIQMHESGLSARFVLQQTWSEYMSRCPCHASSWVQVWILQAFWKSGCLLWCLSATHQLPAEDARQKCEKAELHLWVQILSHLSKFQVNWGVTSLPVQFKMFNSKCLKGCVMKEWWSMRKNLPYVGEKWLL